MSLRKLAPLRNVSKDRGLQREPHLAHHKYTAKNYWNLSLCHYVISVRKTSAVDITMFFCGRVRSKEVADKPSGGGARV